MLTATGFEAANREIDVLSSLEGEATEHRVAVAPLSQGHVMSDVYMLELEQPCELTPQIHAPRSWRAVIHLL